MNKPDVYNYVTDRIVARLEDSVTQIEELIDSVGLSRTIELVASICFDKSEHISANWQDSQLARDWERAGNALLGISCKASINNVSPGISEELT